VVSSIAKLSLFLPGKTSSIRYSQDSRATAGALGSLEMPSSLSTNSAQDIRCKRVFQGIE